MRLNPIAVPLVCIATLSVLLGQAPKPVSPLPGDWPMFSHDLSATRFSPLTQITAKNVSKLTRAWTYRLRSEA
jgi:glucose dehydrogenase